MSRRTRDRITNDRRNTEKRTALYAVIQTTPSYPGGPGEEGGWLVPCGPSAPVDGRTPRDTAPRARAGKRIPDRAPLRYLKTIRLRVNTSSFARSLQK